MPKKKGRKTAEDGGSHSVEHSDAEESPQENVRDPVEVRALKQEQFKFKLSITQIERFKSYVETLVSGNIVESSSVLRTKLEILAENYSRFQESATSLASFEIDIDSHFMECSRIEDLVDGLRSALSNLLEKSTATKATPSQFLDARLPLVEVPVFDGQPENWTAFHQLFSSVVDEREDVSPLVKMQHLVGKLKDRALDVVKDFPLSAENYQVAFELLKRRYHNPRMQVDRLLGTLFGLPQVAAESADGLRTILDKSSAIVKALENLEYPLDKLSNVIVVRALTRKLDAHTKELYEQYAQKHDFGELQTFLETRIPIVESLAKSKPRKPAALVTKSMKSNMEHRSRSSSFVAVNSAISSSCGMCEKEHKIVQCTLFLALSPNDRFNKIKELKICVRCLEGGHYVKDCKAPVCATCKGGHHVLLHFPPRIVQTTQSIGATYYVSRSPNGILPTARVLLMDKHGGQLPVRALIDQGSTDHVVTRACAERLGAPIKRCSFSIAGVGGSNSPALSSVSLELFSPSSYFTVGLEATVLDQITTHLPIVPVDTKLAQWIRGRGLPLADPDFDVPGPIDILLGVDLYHDIIDKVEVSVPNSRLYLDQSKFGWIVSGSWGSRTRNCRNTQPENKIVCNLALQLERFWECEELPNEVPVSAEHKQCEEHFVRTHTRLPSGRFIVRLPLTAAVNSLGSTRRLAINCFKNLERRGISDEYRNFMAEYEQLGHMEKTNFVAHRNLEFHVPHHGVHNTRKLRVVFNASAKSSNGQSLNDCMMVGPTIQPKLFEILLRFRLYQFVLSTDIVKMYRQVQLHTDDRDLQKIVWREQASLPLEEYRLNTVTYGTASAPFLAIRCLFQLAVENENDFPLAARAIRENSYVDDILAGAATLDETIRLRDELIALLAKGQFELSKWCSNHPRIIEIVENPVVNLVKNSLEKTKALGLEWKSDTDTFAYAHVATELPPDKELSKRFIMSEISKVFDPLGLVAPIILRGKMFIQQLWLARCDWDDCVPDDIHVKFKQFYADLVELPSLTIDRWLNVKLENCELHTFVDASDLAMAAAVYAREEVEGEVRCNLICAKSRVAPIKPLVIARKELCAAVIGAKLITSVASVLGVPTDRQFGWSDSTTVLAWLAKTPSTWKPFVANRVADIHSLLPGHRWRKIPGTENPADVASRSCTVRELRDHSLWWHGPPQLHNSRMYRESSHDNDVSNVTAIQEERRSAASHVTSVVESSLISFERVSLYLRLVRAIAYVRRVITNGKLSRLSRIRGPLTPHELECALHTIVKEAQRRDFATEWQLLKSRRPLPSKNRLVSLNPFIDEHGLIRVGGRLQNALVEYNTRHPLLLHANHPFATMIIRHYHRTLNHGGSLLVHNSIRSNIWLIGNARGRTRAEIRKCVRCIRFAQANRNTATIMGQLPAARVTVNKVFEVTGIDYAGPLVVKLRGGRCKTTMKVYLAVFVCFGTKAIHMEIVDSLTTIDFLAALRRFISRRGMPQKLYSDNGTTFVGANTELRSLFEFLAENNSDIANFAANCNIEWSFIPPHAPEMGGLWEAAVKSFKTLFRRVVGQQLLNRKELETIVVQIEACLNSRPLAYISRDANDLAPITPGHFLIGRPLIALLSTSVMQSKSTSLYNRWSLVQDMVGQFWKRWSSEYLHTLQQRGKWCTTGTPPRIGDVVIIREPNLPPTHWLLGCIMGLHPGQDGQVRVVDLRTKNGLLKRPITRLVPLVSAKGTSSQDQDIVDVKM